MKQAACIVGICFLSAFALTAEAAKVSDAFRRALVRGARAKVIVSVHDDEGAPVSDAAVTAAIARGDDEYSIHGSTDINGKWIFDGETTGNYIQISVHKSGYYDSKIKFSYIDMGAEHEVKDGKWQPYGATEKVTLRRILKPVELDPKGKLFDIPATNSWIAFDVVKMDWVRPYGNGEVNDLELKFEWDGLFQNMSRFQNLQLRFPNCVDGAYVSKNATYSNFMYSYAVQTNANFLNAFEFSMRRENGRYIANKLGSDSEMLCRLRSVTNECGKVVSCSYARFRGIDFGGGVGKGNFYIFRDINPTPNDPNLEDAETARHPQGFPL